MIRLNLLPPEVKEDIAYAKKNAALYQTLIKLIALFVVLVAAVGVVGFMTYKNQQIAKEEKSVAESRLASWKNTETDAKDFAERLNLVSKIRSNNLDWQLVITELAKSTPANVQLTSFDFTANSSSRVSLTGQARSNTDIGTFRELLSKSKLFQYVDIESTSASTDSSDGTKSIISFRITMNLNLTEAKK